MAKTHVATFYVGKFLYCRLRTTNLTQPFTIQVALIVRGDVYLKPNVKQSKFNLYLGDSVEEALRYRLRTSIVIRIKDAIVRS